MAWGLGTLVGNAAVTGTMYGGLGAATSVGKEGSELPGHYAPWAVGAGVDIASDVALTGLVGLTVGLSSPIGAGIMVADMVTDMMGWDLATVAMGHTSDLVNKMDSEYNRLSGQGNNYQMSRGSSQALQRQLQNLSGSGSNVAEMMHN